MHYLTLYSINMSTLYTEIWCHEEDIHILSSFMAFETDRVSPTPICSDVDSPFDASRSTITDPVEVSARHIVPAPSARLVSVTVMQSSWSRCGSAADESALYS